MRIKDYIPFAKKKYFVEILVTFALTGELLRVEHTSVDVDGVRTRHAAKSAARNWVINNPDWEETPIKEIEIFKIKKVRQ